MHTVVRETEAIHAESEDAKQSANDETLSMADRLKVENLQLDAEIAAMKAKTAALDEELDQSSPKSPPRCPRRKEQQEGVASITSSAHPKAAGCLPKEEQPESKRQQAAPVKTICSDTERTGLPEALQREGMSSDSPEPKGPPK